MFSVDFVVAELARRSLKAIKGAQQAEQLQEQ